MIDDREYATVTDIAPRGRPAPLATAATPSKTIPFDYVFEFELTGVENNKVQHTVPVSIEGVFVATSVGYSLVPDERRTSRFVEPVLDDRTAPPAPILVTGEWPGPNSDAARVGLVMGAPDSKVAILLFSPDTREPSVSFEGTLNEDGMAVFPFPGEGSAMAWDRSHRVLGPITPASGISVGPDPDRRQLPAPGDDRVFLYGPAGSNFELLRAAPAGNDATAYVTEGALQDVEVLGITVGRAKVDLSGPLLAGEVLLAREPNSRATSATIVAAPAVSQVPLAAFERGLEAVGADLTQGLRLNPAFANRLQASLPFGQIRDDVRRRLFQTGCSAPTEVSFLYSIDVLGTGRELQNVPIHNIAGLGIANGDRPFRPFAKPFVIQPRSSIRIQIEELSGPPGTLYIVLHGYKTLGTARIPR